MVDLQFPDFEALVDMISFESACEVTLDGPQNRLVDNVMPVLELTLDSHSSR